VGRLTTRLAPLEWRAGPLWASAMLLLVWLAPSSSMAAPSFQLVLPEGPPVVGQEVSLAIAGWDGQAPLTDLALGLRPEQGTVVAEPGNLAPGLWAVRYRAPAKPGLDRAALMYAGVAHPLDIPVAEAPQPAVVAPGRQDTVVGTGAPLRLLVRPTDQQNAALTEASLVVAAAEGEVSSPVLADGGVEVAWSPSTDPFPRAVPIGFRHAGRPGSPPAWTVVLVRARPRVPVQTAPGVEVRLKVAGRTYGPVIAGADGIAPLTIEVRPGETVAEVLAVDPLGNTQRSTLALGGDGRPTLGLMASSDYVPGQPAPQVHLIVLRPDGRAWDGAAPTCATSLGEPMELNADGPGTWHTWLPTSPHAPVYDIRVDCNLLDQARGTLRVPVSASRPTRLVLRAWPPDLEAERPKAQIEAHLEDILGDRQPSDDIALRAELGALVDTTPTRAAIRATYDGAAAVAKGGDRLVAEWSAPVGKGAVGDLLVHVLETSPAEVRVSALVRDTSGRPLPGVEVELRFDDRSTAAVTGARGWADATYPRRPGVLVSVAGARAAGMDREALLYFDRAWFGSTRGPLDPDLSATIDLPISSGVVREVALSTDPQVLQTGGGATARVVVRLVDKAGNTVADDALTLEASSGVLTRPRRRADGAYEATFAPAPGLGWGTVWIRATGADGRYGASTTLEMVPREVRHATGFGAGLLVQRAASVRPTFTLEHLEHVPGVDGPLYARLAAATWANHSSAGDPGEKVELDMRVAALELGVQQRLERGRAALWFGSNFVLAPYRLQVSFDGEPGVDGLGLSSPGFSGDAGAALRGRTGELYLTFSYLFLALPDSDIGWEGQQGGLFTGTGYRFVY
jgi:hypothetical protein